MTTTLHRATPIAGPPAARPVFPRFDLKYRAGLKAFVAFCDEHARDRLARRGSKSWGESFEEAFPGGVRDGILLDEQGRVLVGPHQLEMARRIYETTRESLRTGGVLDLPG